MCQTEIVQKDYNSANYSYKLSGAKLEISGSHQIATCSEILILRHDYQPFSSVLAHQHGDKHFCVNPISPNDPQWPRDWYIRRYHICFSSQFCLALDMVRLVLPCHPSPLVFRSRMLSLLPLCAELFPLTLRHFDNSPPCTAGRY